MAKEISWRAAEYQYFEKDIGWYAVVGLAALILIIIALIQNNFFFAVFILIAAFIVGVLGKKRPQVLDFKVGEKGVAVGENLFYDYEDLESFSIQEHDHKLNEIILKKKTVINPFVRMPIDSETLKNAENILSAHLPKDKYEDSIIDNLSDLLRF